LYGGERQARRVGEPGKSPDDAGVVLSSQALSPGIGQHPRRGLRQMSEPMGRTSLLASALKRDRAIVIAALAAVSICGWVYTLAGVGMSMNAFEMTAMGNAGAALATPMPW